MIFLTRLGVFIFILILAGMLLTVKAEEPAQQSKGKKDPNIELTATEITESLSNIIGSYKLQEMEIVGNADSPQFNYIMRWKDPVPFLDETDTLSRGLIDPYYAPLDTEGYREMIQITTDEEK